MQIRNLNSYTMVKPHSITIRLASASSSNFFIRDLANINSTDMTDITLSMSYSMSSTRMPKIWWLRNSPIFLESPANKRQWISRTFMVSRGRVLQNVMPGICEIRF